MRKPGFFRPKLRRRGKSDSSESISWQDFFRRDPGGALVVDDTGPADPTSTSATPLYIAGVGPHASLAFSNGYSSSSAPFPIQGGTMADSTICWGQVLPRGRIVRILTGVTGDPAGPGSNGFVRFGVYTNKDGATNLNLYPNQLLYDSGDVEFETLGPKESLLSGSGLAVSRGLYWFVMAMNAAACSPAEQAIPCVDTAYMLPPMGKTVRWGGGEPVNNSSVCVGWRHALTFGALPQQFPSSAPVRVLNSASLGNVVPIIFFGFSPA